MIWIHNIQFIIYSFDVKKMLQYVQTDVRLSKKDLWIMTNAKNDGTPVDAAYGEQLHICTT